MNIETALDKLAILVTGATDRKTQDKVLWFNVALGGIYIPMILMEVV